MSKRESKPTPTPDGRSSEVWWGTPEPVPTAQDGGQGESVGSGGAKSANLKDTEPTPPTAPASEGGLPSLGTPSRNNNPENVGGGGDPKLNKKSRKRRGSASDAGTVESKADTTPGPGPTLDDVSVTPEEVERKKTPPARVSSSSGGFGENGESRQESRQNGEIEKGTAETSVQADTAASDLLLQRAGFSAVDLLDEEDYRKIREAKSEALEQLVAELVESKNNSLAVNGRSPLTPTQLSNIVHKLAQVEKDKLAVIQLKVGKPSERAKPNYKFRAKIGVAARVEEATNPQKAAVAAIEVEVSEGDAGGGAPEEGAA